MSEIAKLYDLQKIDSAFDQVRRRLLEIQKQREESEELISARQSVLKTETALSERRTRQQDTEMQAQSLDERIKETDANLMSGDISNPKELQALQDNLEMLRKQKDTADEHAVNALLEAETLRQRLEQQQEELESAEGTWRSGQSSLNEEELALKRKYTLLKKHREAGRTLVDDDTLTKYEQVRKRKSGIAIALVVDDTCGVCNMQLPTAIMGTLMSSGDRLNTCPSCGRILYAN